MVPFGTSPPKPNLTPRSPQSTTTRTILTTEPQLPYPYDLISGLNMQVASILSDLTSLRACVSLAKPLFLTLPHPPPSNTPRRATTKLLLSSEPTTNSLPPPVRRVQLEKLPYRLPRRPRRKIRIQTSNELWIWSICISPSKSSIYRGRMLDFSGLVRMSRL